MQLLPEQRDNPDVLGAHDGSLNKIRAGASGKTSASIGRGAGPASLQRYNREFQVSVFGNVAAGYPLDLAAAHTVQSIKENGIAQPAIRTSFRAK